MGLRHQTLRYKGSLHRVGAQRYRFLIVRLAVDVGDDALFIHAVTNFDGILHGGIRRSLDVQLDVINGIQQGQIAGGELELIDGDPIALLHILLNEVHGKWVDDDAVVDLDDQLRAVKQAGRLFHQQNRGEGHEIQRPAQRLGAVLCQEAVNRVRGGVFVLRGHVAGEGLILTVVEDLMAPNFSLRILNRLAHDIFIAHTLLRSVFIRFPARADGRSPSRDGRSPACSSARPRPAPCPCGAFHR